MTRLVTAAAGLLLAAALAFTLTEHVSFLTAAYWVVVTAATVGYGDVAPHDTAGRLVAVGTILTTVPLLAAVWAHASARIAARRLRHTESMHRIVSDLYEHVTGQRHPHAHGHVEPPAKGDRA